MSSEYRLPSRLRLSVVSSQGSTQLFPTLNGANKTKTPVYDKRRGGESPLILGDFFVDDEATVERASLVVGLLLVSDSLLSKGGGHGRQQKEGDQGGGGLAIKTHKLGAGWHPS